jgi:hypothetical protein
MTVLLLVECTPFPGRSSAFASVVLKVKGGGAPRWKKMIRAKEKNRKNNKTKTVSGGKLVGNRLRIRGRGLTMVTVVCACQV